MGRRKQGWRNRRGRKRKLEQEQEQEQEPSEVINESDNDVPNENNCDAPEEKQLKVTPASTASTDNSLNENASSRSNVEPRSPLCEYLLGEEEKSDDVNIEMTDTDSIIDIRCSENSASPHLLLKTDTSFEEAVESCIKPLVNLWKEVNVELEEKKSEEDCSSESGEDTTLSDTSQSSLVKGENTLNRPWLENEEISPDCSGMSETEEAEHLRKIRDKISQGEMVSVADIRLHRKLTVRQVKRLRGLQIFDLQASGRSFWASIDNNEEKRILDRYQCVRLLISATDHLNLFRTRITGYTEQYSRFISPYTKRVLAPFIRRDYGCVPLWLRLMEDVQRKANRNDPGWSAPQRESVDYCYLRPHHLPAVNSLAELYFWPGINMTECLQYPDFSCVVFYKKLLVGFAFAIPDVARNEAYISFLVVRTEWQRAGIGSFMLYHVIETCKGKDLTVHVAPSSPAFILYQKFGFKVKSFEENFFDRYLPCDSTKDRNAFLLRCDNVV